MAWLSAATWSRHWKPNLVFGCNSIPLVRCAYTMSEHVLYSFVLPFYSVALKRQHDPSAFNAVVCTIDNQKESALAPV